MSKKTNHKTVKANSVFVPLRTKMNEKSGNSKLEFSKGVTHDLSGCSVAKNKKGKLVPMVKAPNGSVTSIVARYDDGRVQTVSGDTWEIVTWEKSNRKGPKLAQYVAIK